MTTIAPTNCELAFYLNDEELIKLADSSFLIVYNGKKYNLFGLNADKTGYVVFDKEEADRELIPQQIILTFDELRSDVECVIYNLLPPKNKSLKEEYGWACLSNFEILIPLSEIRNICKSGNNDEAVAEALKLDIIDKQMKSFDINDLKSELLEYGIEEDELKTDKDIYSFALWTGAWNYFDEERTPAYYGDIKALADELGIDINTL